MPLVRVEVRNQYGIGSSEMYMEANDDEPKEIFEGVAVAGLVGVLRQLGDLADFAAEVFHGLQEEVMIASSRSCKLMCRVQHIEAALVPVEKALLAQKSHVHLAYSAGLNWHAPVRCENHHFVYNDMPEFILNSYEECRSPPHFHLLDRFDLGGPGSCLRRYSDPTIFIEASETSGDASQKVARYMQVQMSNGSQKQRNGEVSGGASFGSRSARMQFPQSMIGGLTPSHSTLRSDSYEQSNSDQINESGCSKDFKSPSYSMQTKEQETEGFISPPEKSHGSDDQTHTFLKEDVTDECDYNLTREQGLCSPYSDHDTDLESFIPRLDLENLPNDAYNYETVDRLDVAPLIQSPSSSPPLAHMKISVQPMTGFKTSKLKLIDRGSLDMFPSFQLVPKVSNTCLNNGSDSDDDDTICISSPSLADDFLDHHSEQWEPTRPPGGEHPDLCDSLSRISLGLSVSTIHENCGLQFSSVEPEFGTVDPPLLPPVQWWVHVDASENSHHSASSTSQQHQQNLETRYEQKCKPFSSEKLNSHIDDNNFLNQIRRQSLSLRPTVPAKRTSPSRSSTNAQVMTILEKANAIRQAVGSDDGDNWSDT